MHWYDLLACFFAGAFLANFVPHYVQGVCGEPFPTPFAKPPGKGLSSPIVNVLWALLNLAIAGVLFHAGKVWNGGGLPLTAFFAGIVLISVMSSIGFQSKHAK
jgi:hypothetical protein